ncbi:MAG TPA: S26 family signal peptidase [Hyphomonas sp.]|nr:S26 family signal peptidase [Hyphomonas sp.]HRK69325.1 S26 family signal peptidase [Hyphomonas sp.]
MKSGSLSTQASLGVAGLAVAALSFAVLNQQGLVLYNPSSSLEPGFYVRADANAERGTVVTISVRAVDLDYVEAGRVKAAGDRFLKRIAAVGGDRVCSENGQILINDVHVATASRLDSAGVALPQWSGCATLGNGEVFLLGDDEMSFDGRYWGVTSAANIEGTWRKFP